MPAISTVPPTRMPPAVGVTMKARAGQIPEFTGISSPYEPPEQPDVRLRTAEMSVAGCAATLIHHLRERGIVPEAHQQ